MPKLNITTVPAELVGQLHATPHYLENFEDYQHQVLTALVEKGYPAHLWPIDNTTYTTMFVRRVMWSGECQETVLTEQLMDHASPYTGPKPNELVLMSFNKEFGMHQNALFVFTNGEDWWPYEHAWLAHNADTFMQYILYRKARQNPALITQPKKRGRPRSEPDPVALQAKADRKARYEEWLAACEAHRQKVLEAENRYQEARRVMEEMRAARDQLKAQGAPRWEP